MLTPSRLDTRVSSIMAWVDAYVKMVDHPYGTRAEEQVMRAKVADAVRLAFKEQDRDTRHACAEAVCGVLATSIAADPAIVDALRQAERAAMNAHSV